MSTAALGSSLLLLAIPALALPLVRRGPHPAAWAFVIATSLATGFVILEVELLHIALPTALDVVGAHELAEVCRQRGGHLFRAAAPFGVLTGTLALTVAVKAGSGVLTTIRGFRTIREGALLGRRVSVAGHDAFVLPLRDEIAVAVPGESATPVLSRGLVEALQHEELSVVVQHEIAHLRNHHPRFVLLGTTVSSGLWFLPWIGHAESALRLALERWADEEAAGQRREGIEHIRSALRKLVARAPSTLVVQRLAALDLWATRGPGSGWGWRIAGSVVGPLAIAVAAAMLAHVGELVHEVTELAQ